jgi:hypothetical protein
MKIGAEYIRIFWDSPKGFAEEKKRLTLERCKYYNLNRDLNYGQNFAPFFFSKYPDEKTN